MIDKPEKYLDKVLEILSENFDRVYTAQDIQNRLTPMKIFGEKGSVLFGEDLLKDLREALAYLQSKNLVQLSAPFDDKIKITFEGYMKLKTNSFSKEVSDKSLNQRLQRIAWVLPIIISLVALSVALFKNQNYTVKKAEIFDSTYQHRNSPPKSDIKKFYPEPKNPSKK